MPAVHKGCFYKVGIVPTLQGQSDASDSQPVSTFLLLTQTQVLSSVE